MRVTQTVSPHVFLFGVKTARLVKWAVVVLARNQVFPAIVFSAVSFFLVSFFSLLVFSSSISWSACQHFLHIGRRDRQVDFIGNGFFGCGVLLTIVS